MAVFRGGVEKRIGHLSLGDPLMGVNSRPTVPRAVNIGRCGGPSRPTRRPKASPSRPKTRGNDEFLMSNDERTPKVFAST